MYWCGRSYLHKLAIVADRTAGYAPTCGTSTKRFLTVIQDIAMLVTHAGVGYYTRK